MKSFSYYITTTMLFSVFMLWFLLPWARGADDSVKTERKTYVVIVGGINKDPEQRQAKDKAILRLRKILQKDYKLDPANIHVLVAKNSFVVNPNGLSRAADLEKLLGRLAKTIVPDDRFIFYYTGQANVVAEKLRLNLPGPDITHEQLAAQLENITAAEQLIILDCPCAGLAVKTLTAKGKNLNLCLCSDQPYSTRFSEFFVPALVDSGGKNDYNKDGRISLLESFQWTAYQLDELYRQQSLMLTEVPQLEDNGDGIASQQPWRYPENKQDGRYAGGFYLSDK